MVVDLQSGSIWSGGAQAKWSRRWQCPLCGTMEDSNYIFFSSISTQFMWTCLRETIRGHWCNTNFPGLYVEIQASPPSGRYIRWLVIGVLAWTLGTVQNKLVIQRVPLRRAIDAVFKMCCYMQLWRPLSRQQDEDAIDSIFAALQTMASRLAPSLPPPPPEPD